MLHNNFLHIFFLNNQLSFQYRIFHFQVSCETAFSTIRKYGIGLQVFLVISKINMEFLNPLYRKTLLWMSNITPPSSEFLSFLYTMYGNVSGNNSSVDIELSIFVSWI